MSTVRTKGSTHQKQMEQSNRKLTVTFANDGVVNTTLGEFIPTKIQDPKSAYAATLHMILKHTSDVFLTIVDVIAEKYGHSAEEMAETILAHPKFNEMYANPMIHELGYFETKPASASPSTEAKTDKDQETKRAEAKAKLKAKRMAKDISGGSVDALTESMESMVLLPLGVSTPPKEEQQPKKMVTVKRVKKVVFASTE